MNSFRWSPNGKRILAELFMASVDETGKTTDSVETLVLEDTGKEVKGGGNEKQIENADNATWLLDNNTVDLYERGCEAAGPVFVQVSESQRRADRQRL